MHGEERELYGDSGYIGAEKRENAVIKNKNGKNQIQNKQKTLINEKAFQKRTVCEKTECKKSSVRAKTEHFFVVVKRLFGYRKTRYRGLRKQNAKLNTMFTFPKIVSSAKSVQWDIA